MKDSIPSTFTANLLEPQGHRFEGYFPPGAVAYAQSGDNLRTSAGPGKDLEQIWRVWDGDGWKEDGKSATGWCSRLLLGWFCGMFLDVSRTDWWFGTFFIFRYIGNNHPN